MSDYDDVPLDQPSFRRCYLKSETANAHHAYVCATSLAIAIGFESACEPGIRILSNEETHWLTKLMLFESFSNCSSVASLTDKQKQNMFRRAMYFGRKPKACRSPTTINYYILFPNLTQPIQNSPGLLQIWHSKVVEPAWHQSWNFMKIDEYQPRHYLKFNWLGIHKECVTQMRQNQDTEKHHNLWPAGPTRAENMMPRDKILDRA